MSDRPSATDPPSTELTPEDSDSPDSSGSVGSDSPDSSGSVGSAEHLVAMVFDKPGRANEVLVNLTNLQDEGSIVMGDAVIIAKDQDGRAEIRQMVDVTPIKGAAIGTWIGLLASIFAGPLAIAGGAAAGALYGKLIDKGLDDNWIKRMSEWLQPGTSGLLLLVTIEQMDQLLSELRRYEGRLVTTDFPDAVRMELEDALRNHIS